MYNVFKNKVRPYFFNTFSKSTYKLLSEVEGKEELYCRDNKLVVVVKDYKIGNRIFSTIKSLSESEEKISAGDVTFSIGDYFVDKYDRVEMFYVNFETNLHSTWNELSDLKKLQQFVAFVEAMERKGYIFDNEKFDISVASCFSGFISFFGKGEDVTSSGYGNIIRYIHYVFSGCNDFDSLYGRIVYQNQMYAISDFSYSLPVIKMCYYYFVTGEYSLTKICMALERESLENDLYKNSTPYYANYSIVAKKDLSSNFAVTEECDEYTVYDGCIKIYKQMQSSFETFLRDDSTELISGLYAEVIENVTCLIIDFDANIIGYKFQMQQIDNSTPISDKQFNSQHDIFEYMSILGKYISRLSKSLEATPSFSKNDFAVERDMVCYSEGFKVINPMAMYNLSTNDQDLLDNQILLVFFKLYFEYLKDNYGDISNEEEYFKKCEIRYLSPVLAKAFVSFVTEGYVDYSDASKEFKKFLYETCRFENQNFVYDSRFGYNPTKVPFSFDYEVKEKYGIDIRFGVDQELPDGRHLITTHNLWNNVSQLINYERNRQNAIIRRINGLSSNVSVAQVSEVIYSKEINQSDSSYRLVGFVTTPYKGKALTQEVLLGLSNKDFFKIAGKLFTYFNNYYVELDSCYIDDDFNVYINIFDRNFAVKEYESFGSFTKWMADSLVSQGYSANAFVDVNFRMSSFSKYADSLDSYCEEHKIYYNSKDKMCPVCAKAKAFVDLEDLIARGEKVFEDEIATHYKLNYAHNIKVYKAEVKKASLEKNVDSIIGLRLLNGEVNLSQDCFVPYKKAVDNNNQFVGYIYQAVPFKPVNGGTSEYCVNIEDMEAMKNLPRLMSLIRLLSQVDDLTRRGYYFIRNPFGTVFLNKDHKKQVQILNIEFLTKGNKTKNSSNTVKWTCEYVYKVLESDSSFDLSSLSNQPMRIDPLYDKLQTLAKSMTRYCPVHKMYYKDSELFCPKCIDRRKMKNLNIEYVRVSDFTDSDHENEGGESFIYPYGEDQVAKIFKEKEIDYNFKNIVLARVLNRATTLKKLNQQNSKYQYVVPQKILIDRLSGHICGYVMDRVVDAMPLSNLRDKDQIEKLGFTRKDVFEVLINAGEGIEVLHSKVNMFIGDLNGRNILFDRNKKVYFLDFDGMGVDNIAPMFWTDGYIDPVSAKNHNISMKDDWYSFAIQAFYYLTYTHPFNGIYYVSQNGRKVNLEIPDKMERRISLLGNHGIEIPDIAEPWNWMLNELQIMFLNIFEGNNRESIVPLLNKQYEALYGKSHLEESVVTAFMEGAVEHSFQCPEESSEIIRINPKFVAKAVNPFNCNVAHIINPFAAVCTTGSDEHVVITDKYNPILHYEVEIRDCNEIKNILLLGDNTTAWVIYDDKIVAMDLKSGEETYVESYPNVENPVVNDNTLYFLCNNNIIHLDYKADGSFKKGQINFLNERLTKHFFAQFNSKFIMIKAGYGDTDDIYCNAIKLCDMTSDSDTKYNVMYDSSTKIWLVINNEGLVVAINANTGEYEKFNIQAEISDMNVENVVFHKGKLYIPMTDSLYIVNVKNQAAKKMECPKIMTPDSKLFDINSSGYSVATDCNLYEIRRG